MVLDNNSSAITIDTVIAISDLNRLKNEMLFNGLADYINQLILTNFERLVQLLYRIDVSEEKIKYLLRHHPNENAGEIIARLIIDRQIQKVQFKKEMEEKQDEICDEERW